MHLRIGVIKDYKISFFLFCCYNFAGLFKSSWFETLDQKIFAPSSLRAGRRSLGVGKSASADGHHERIPFTPFALRSRVATSRRVATSCLGIKMEILKNISLNNKNWFKTGGNSKYFCEPTTASDFQEALAFAQTNNQEIFVLGKGANILISDDGFDGLTISPKIKELHIEDEMVTAGAGVEIQELIDFCLDNNFIGLEEFSCIPGTVGGSVFINIHYFDYFLSHFLIKAKIINKTTGEISTVDKAWFNFGYDQSKLHEGQCYLVNATFLLEKVDQLKTEYAKGRRDEIIRHRIRRYPTSNTCGSFFRNFHENEITLEINGKKLPFIAYYLDKIGIKGDLRVGNAIVSSKHANMIETLPGGTSTDVINLAKKMQELVFEKFGLVPQPECVLVGFKENPFVKNSKTDRSKSFHDKISTTAP
jgi:UDP-N-acetylmuramate dehydrogenase